jgi:hypothetical protein
MLLVDSYLHEVSRFLPASQRADVVGELRATIEDEVIERAAAHGGTATREDEAAVLARFGHPLKVASGYQSRRYLIGPDLFPAFRTTLSTLLVVVLALQVLVALVVSAGTGWTLSVGGLVSQLVESVFWVAVIVTLVFVGIEGAGERLRWYERWEPGSLGTGAVSVIDRSTVITNIITEGVFLLWWNGVLTWRTSLAGAFDAREPVTLALSDVWSPLFWPLNVVFAAFFALHAYVLVRGLWQRWTLNAEVLLGAAALALAAWVLVPREALIVVSGPLDGFVAQHLQRTVWWTVAVIAGFVAWDLYTAVRLIRRPTT